MKRIKRITGRDVDAKISVTIQVETGAGKLLRREVEQMMDSLADSAMHMVAGTRYVHVPLSRVQVR
jgi:hypothetical protein